MKPKLHVNPQRRRWVILFFVAVTLAAMLLLHILWRAISNTGSKHHRRHSKNGKQGSNDSRRRVVLLAGPQYAASTSVINFFRTYAQVNKHMLPGWTYVECPPEQCPNLNLGDHHKQPPHQEWSHLVHRVHHQDDPQLVEELLTRIQHVWEQSGSDSIILGTEQFAKVPPTPYSNVTSLPAMDQIRKRLKLESSSQITVVLQYRRPRVNQWRSVWSTVAPDLNYTDFICQDDQKLILEEVNVNLNPLRLASVFQQQGYKVALVDMEAIQAASLDVSHVIACTVLNAQCNQHPGWVNGLYDHEFHDHVHEQREFGIMSEQEIHQMEQLFVQRDCAYRKEGAASVVGVRPDGATSKDESTVWDTCHDQYQEQYEQLKNAVTFVDALRSQNGCVQSVLNITDVLSPETIEGNEASENNTSSNVTADWITDDDQSTTAKGHHIGLFVAAILLVVLLYKKCRRSARPDQDMTRSVEMRPLKINGFQVV